MNVVQRVDVSIFNEFIESVFVEIPNDVFRMGKSIVVGVIYRPPGTDVSECYILLKEILSKIQKEGKICYLLGDYDIDLFNYEVHSPTAEFIDLMHSHSLMPLVNRPTRISGHSATLIDNIFNNNYQNVCETMQAILVTDISDHFPVIHINWNATDDNHEWYVVKRHYGAMYTSIETDRAPQWFSNVWFGLDLKGKENAHSNSVYAQCCKEFPEYVMWKINGLFAVYAYNIRKKYRGQLLHNHIIK